MGDLPTDKTGVLKEGETLTVMEQGLKRLPPSESYHISFSRETTEVLLLLKAELVRGLLKEGQPPARTDSPAEMP